MTIMIMVEIIILKMRVLTVVYDGAWDEII